MTSLLSFLALYKWSVLAGAITAPVLSFMGAQLASRDQAIQTLCIGQGATLGVLVTLAVIAPFDTDAGFLRDCGIPLVGSLIFCGLSFWFTQWLTENKQSSKATYFVIFFAALSASGYMVCALVPALENHMTQMFFGDLATLSNLEAFLAIGFSSMAMVVFFIFWRKVTRRSFRLYVFGRDGLNSVCWGERSFLAACLILLSHSIHSMGLLFTLGAMFIPTATLRSASVRAGRGLKHHFLSCGVLALLGAVFGFLLSLSFSRLPTVPTIVLLWLALGFAWSTTVTILAGGRGHSG